MSKVLKTVGAISGSIAQFLPFPANVIASAQAILYSAVGNALSKKPPVKGQVNNILIAKEAPMSCVIGRSYVGGAMSYDKGYGATLSDVPNPYRWIVNTYGVGPAESIEDVLAEFEPLPRTGTAVTGFWAGFLFVTTQLGLSPEAAALTPEFAGAPEWSASSLLSGKVAVGYSLKFDKKGKKWGAGVPQLGIIANGPPNYDAREDSTQPGGSGSQRPDDESTWGYDRTPASAAASYIIGRRQNGVLVFGIGDEDPDTPGGYSSIDWPTLMAWANVCEANGWRADGEIEESGQDGEKWANLKRICEAGGCVPVQTGTGWTFVYQAPGVAVATIGKADYAGEISFDAMRDSRDRPNGLIPRPRSEAHRWEPTSGEIIQYAAYVTEDGEERTQVHEVELVTDKDQHAELTAYALLDAREFGPIDIPLKAGWRNTRVGTKLIWDDPEEGIEEMAVVVQRVLYDVESAVTTLTLVSETEGKHDFALGRTLDLPPAPTLGAAEAATEVAEAIITNQETSTTTIILASSGGSGAMSEVLTSSDAGADARIDVAAHDRAGISYSSGAITGLAFETIFYVYFDDPSEAGGAVSYQATTSYDTATDAAGTPGRVYVGFITTPANGGPTYSGGGIFNGGTAEP